MIPALRSAVSALSPSSARNHLDHFEDVESRQQRRLIHYTAVSIGIVVVFLIPHRLIIPDVFWAAAAASLGFIVPLLLLTVVLAHRRRRAAAESALLTAFCGMSILVFWIIGSSKGDPRLLALYALGICSLMFIWCNATFGIRLWKPALCYLLISVNIIAMFTRLRGLSWQSVLCLALLTATTAVMALLSNVFLQWDERGFVSEGQRLLSAIVAGRHDLWAFDIPTGRAEVLRATASGPRRTSGLDYDRYLSLVDPADRQYAIDFIHGCIANGESRTPCQYRLRSNSKGECAWYEGIGKVVEYDLSGRPITLFGMTNNISDQKYLTRQLQQQSEEIARATRAKSDILATMSHEIRTPLNGILGMSSLLADMELPAGQRQMVSIVQSSGAVLLQILNDVLDFSKIEAGKLSLTPAPFEVKDVVESCMRSVQASAQAKHLTTAIRLSPEVSPWVAGDAVCLGKILTHVLANAVSFTREGGVDLAVSAGALASGGAQTIRFAVRDTGIGMDQEARKRLFSPFIRVHGNGLTGASGTGLGLAISKSLVEAMGGSIACSSVLGQGSCFTIELSLATCVPPPARPAGSGRTGPVRMLIAEDNPVNQVVIERMVRRLGYTPTVVSNGREAVEAVSGGSYDIVLMDCEMPVLDGMEATRLIRRIPGRGQLPIIALSAHSLEGGAAACLASGMSAYLTKPVDSQILRETLLRWL